MENKPKDVSSPVLRLDASLRLPTSAPEAFPVRRENRLQSVHRREIDADVLSSAQESKILVRTLLRDGAVAETDPHGAAGARPDAEDASGGGGDLGSAENGAERSRAGRVDDVLKAKIAALEAAIARIDDSWEPDGVASDAYSGTQSLTMDWAKPSADTGRRAPYRLASEARCDPPPLESGSVRAENAHRPVAEDNVTVETIREIVTDVVRRELPSVLGEKIAQEVRTAVAQEVLRAIAGKKVE